MNKFNVEMPTALAFDDVLCVPKFSSIESRDDVTLKQNWAGIDFPSFVLCANMPTIVDFNSAKAMIECGIVPVFDRERDVMEICKDVQSLRRITDMPIGVSVGVKQKEVSNILEYMECGATFVVLDVAHANSPAVADQIKRMLEINDSLPLIVGNFAAFPNVDNFGFALHKKNIAWKIGVGSGANCTTRIKTGHGLPTLHSILMWRQAKMFPDTFIIADGGMKNPGDICKAIAAGADMVMLGSMLAGAKESPGPTIKGNDGKIYKVHAGNASFSVKKNAGRETKYIEGVESLVEVKGTMEKISKDIFDGVKSGFSYSGAKNISEFKNNSTLIKVTASGHAESKPHIFS